MRIAWHHVTHARQLAAVKWKQHSGAKQSTKATRASSGA
jgi:hypothetical protein